MRKARHTVSALLSAILIPLSLPGNAQVVDISDCRVIVDRLERFACYENLGDTARPAAPVRATQPAEPAPAVRPPQRTETVPAVPPRAQAAAEVENFGRNTETAMLRVIEGTDGKTELLDTVAGLSQPIPNTWVVTLQSGQTWRQTTGKRYALREGDEVRIYPTRWGNAYRLTASRLSGYIQVERVD